ncbi:MAG: hypothetical protein AB7I27_13295 [Bacteriovoracaceae bacterium]
MKTILAPLLIASTLFTAVPKADAVVIYYSQCSLGGGLSGDGCRLLSFVAFLAVGGIGGFILLDESQQVAMLKNSVSEIQDKYHASFEDASQIADLIYNKARVSYANGDSKLRISNDEMMEVVSDEFLNSQGFIQLMNGLK